MATDTPSPALRGEMGRRRDRLIDARTWRANHLVSIRGHRRSAMWDNVRLRTPVNEECCTTELHFACRTGRARATRDRAQSPSKSWLRHQPTTGPCQGESRSSLKRPALHASDWSTTTSRDPVGDPQGVGSVTCSPFFATSPRPTASSGQRRELAAFELFDPEGSKQGHQLVDGDRRWCGDLDPNRSLARA